jgi:sec-independent protein translocase protein TatA
MLIHKFAIIASSSGHDFVMLSPYSHLKLSREETTDMGLSVWQIALVALIFILLFGRGKIPTLMTDLAEGIKGFKKGIKEDVAEPELEKPVISDDTTHPSDKL